MTERISESPSSVVAGYLEAGHRLVGIRVLVVEDEPDTREPW